MKSNLVVFRDCKGMAHIKFLPPRQTVAAAFYFTWKSANTSLEITDSWKLHQDSPSHTTFAVRDYLTKHRVPMLSQPSTAQMLVPSTSTSFSTLDWNRLRKDDTTAQSRLFKRLWRESQRSAGFLRSNGPSVVDRVAGNAEWCRRVLLLRLLRRCNDIINCFKNSVQLLPEEILYVFAEM